MIWLVFWTEFWAVFFRRPSAELFHLDDYRPPKRPTTPSGRRAA